MEGRDGSWRILIIYYICNMIYILKNAVLLNRLPVITEAIEATPLIPATENTPEIPAVEASPKTYTFTATIFIGIEGTKEGEFIQDKNIAFTVTDLNITEKQLLIEAQEFINKNYNEN